MEEWDLLCYLFQGAQTTQLLVEPPWRPAVLWDRVTLTCQGLGTAGATTWYKDGQRWGPNRSDNFTVTARGTYQCYRPGTGHSPTVTVSYDWLVLQVPTWPLLEGDTVTLRCRGWRNMSVTLVQFYRGDEEPLLLAQAVPVPLQSPWGCGSALFFSLSLWLLCQDQQWPRKSRNSKRGLEPPEELWQWQHRAPAFLTIPGEFNTPNAAVPWLKEEKGVKGSGFSGIVA
ncbi:hypothetical protein HGM15179_021533 [Zosterops borbonicus]|uniref:Ig-like domain-containing protein n=1 Tax=Zosterops borbonicus TaxID=364589 RepID=A0A8K1FTY2_9PASS|nr:hypothetical protein HGM15179_021533 [Zosterops borbonicus]